MTLDDFSKSLVETKPPAKLTQALAGLWWDAKAIGRGPTNPPSRTEDPMVRGYTSTFIARKAIRAMQPTGIVARVSPYAEKHSMQNGSVSVRLAGTEVTEGFCTSAAGLF